MAKMDEETELELEKMCKEPCVKLCENELLSEARESYQLPKLKKPPTTRSKLMEQFLWREFYDEYLRYNEGINKMVIPEAFTEYYDEYCKKIKLEDATIKEALAARYPLYATTAVTLWNPTGDITKDFKKRYSITRPVSECSEQFG